MSKAKSKYIRTHYTDRQHRAIYKAAEDETKRVGSIITVPELIRQGLILRVPKLRKVMRDE